MQNVQLYDYTCPNIIGITSLFFSNVDSIFQEILIWGYKKILIEDSYQHFFFWPPFSQLILWLYFHRDIWKNYFSNFKDLYNFCRPPLHLYIHSTLFPFPTIMTCIITRVKCSSVQNEHFPLCEVFSSQFMICFSYNCIYATTTTTTKKHLITLYFFQSKITL